MKKILISLKHLSELIFNAKRHIRNHSDLMLMYLGIWKTARIGLIEPAVINIRKNSTDHYTVHEIVVRDDYLLRDTNLKGDVIDIGANIGVFSVYCAALFPKSRIFSYEPVPENYSALVTNTQKFRNVKTFRSLVLGKKGSGKIFISDENEGKHSILDNSGKEIIAKSTTLKDIFSKNKIKSADLVKMDVEGAEYDILYNTEDEVLSKIKRIHMEYHDSEENTGRTLADFLRAKGFEVKIKKAIFSNHGYLYCHR